MSKIGFDFNAGQRLPAECSQAGDVPPACADASAGREAACFGPVASLPAADRDGEGAKTRSERSACLPDGELGNLIPKGLLDEDGYCFDVDAYDEILLFYIGGRINEAYHAYVIGQEPSA